MIDRRHLVAGLVVCLLPVPAFARRRRRSRSSRRASPSPSRSEAYSAAVLGLIVLVDDDCPQLPELVVSPAVRDVAERFGVPPDWVAFDVLRECSRVTSWPGQ